MIAQIIDPDLLVAAKDVPIVIFALIVLLVVAVMAYRMVMQANRTNQQNIERIDNQTERIDQIAKDSTAAWRDEIGRTAALGDKAIAQVEKTTEYIRQQSELMGNLSMNTASLRRDVGVATTQGQVMLNKIEQLSFDMQGMQRTADEIMVTLQGSDDMRALKEAVAGLVGIVAENSRIVKEMEGKLLEVLEQKAALLEPPIQLEMVKKEEKEDENEKHP